MDIKLVLECILFLLVSIGGGLGIKIEQIYFLYGEYWIIIFYFNIFFCVNIMMYLYYFTPRKLIEDFSNKQLVLKYLPASILYTIESCALYWAFVYVPISVYVISRTSVAFTNVLFTKFYLRKIIPKIHYLGLLFLLLTYILLGVGISIGELSTTSKIAICIVLLSGFTSATYSNMIEKHLDEVVHDKFRNKLFYQIMLNIIGFTVVLPISFGYIMTNKLFEKQPLPNLLFLVVGLCLQTYTLCKIFILAHAEINGNQLANGIDLFRRVLTNIIAYTVFRDKCNVLIICSNVFMFLGSLVFLINKKNTQEIIYVEMKDIINLSCEEQETVK